MNVIYYLQAGENGPVKIAHASIAVLDRRVKAMQEGNPESLAIRNLYAGTDLDLIHTQSINRRHWITTDWYQPAVLDRPAESMTGQVLQELPYDYDRQTERLTKRKADHLAEQARNQLWLQPAEDQP